jgi:SAM-dependent methyltransferase
MLCRPDAADAPEGWRDMKQAAHKISPRLVLTWLKANLKKKGLGGVVNFAISFVSDSWFDLRYGTSTGGWIPSNQLNTKSGNIKHSMRYQATKIRPLRKLMKILRFPENSVFLDIGCGKGRVLLVASEYGFKKVLGVEFTHDLCEIARRNIYLYRRHNVLTSDIEIVEDDIVNYKMTGDENVFYLYNPFNEVILRQLLENIRESVKENPRKIWLIYHIPDHMDVIDDQDIFVRSAEYFVGGTEFLVYESK